jgi:chlorobactene glucosyltransferase
VALIFFGIIGFLLGLLGITIYNVLTAPQLGDAPQSKLPLAVSVLIPARNEASNIRACLESLAAQDYPDLEIIVLDDESTDSTAAITNEIARQDGRFKLVRGRPLPMGWLGKNWACHQLSQCAAGDVLIFADADTRCGPRAVAHTVGWMSAAQAGMLSAFPRQITGTLAEKLVVPVIYMLVYSFLPLRLAYRSRSKIFAAANGQWIAFTREAYRKIDGHRAVRNQIVEDVELSRLAKRKNERVLLTCGNGDIACRMYDSWKTVWEGFSKNAFGLAGFRADAMLAIMIVAFLAFIFPYIALLIDPVAPLAMVAVSLNVTIRLILALRYDQPFPDGVLLHPIAVACTMLIGLNSYCWFKTGKVMWKGRKMEIGESCPETFVCK